MNKRGGTAKRFTMEDGDLSTFEGQLKLLKKVFLWKPKRVWMAPECAPWCPWNRFNQMRGLSSFCRIQENQERSREQLTFCSLICKIQSDRGDHFHLENPGPSGMWHQNEMQEICSSTKPAYFDRPVSLWSQASVSPRTHAKENTCSNVLRRNVSKP